jgi:RNA recognition motif-containing protein
MNFGMNGKALKQRVILLLLLRSIFKMSNRSDKVTIGKTTVKAPSEETGGSNSNAVSSTTEKNHRHRLTSKTVFVTGLAPALSRIHIEKLFSKFGIVDRLDIKTSKTGSRYCFVEMDDVEHAQSALDNLNGRTLLHTRLVVQPAHERSVSGQPHHINTSNPSQYTSSSLFNNDPAKERKMLDRKIEDLKRKIKQASAGT